MSAPSLGAKRKEYNFRRQLIDEVRNRRLLYDPAHSKFANVESKEKAWQAIARKLKRDVTACQSIWVGLRLEYQNYVRGLCRFLSRGHAAKKRRPIMLFADDLLFLWRFIDKNGPIQRLPAPDATEATADTSTEAFSDGNLSADDILDVAPCGSQEGTLTLRITSVSSATQATSPQENGTSGTHVLLPPAGLRPRVADVLDVTEEEAKSLQLAAAIANMEQARTVSAITPPADDDDIEIIEVPPVVIDLSDDDEKEAIAAKFCRNLAVSPLMRNMVAEIRKHRELYDVDDPGYEDYKNRGLLWNVIAGKDKATRLMKLWWLMQTRYEWELMQTMRQEAKTGKQVRLTELEKLMSFMKCCTLKNPNTVVKQSFYLQHGWHEPIDVFKNVSSLLAYLQQHPQVVNVTDDLLSSRTKNSTYFVLWGEVAKNREATPAQCEVTWLLLRAFYWELLQMRWKGYMLQDKWFFESYIFELYDAANALRKANKKQPDNAIPSTSIVTVAQPPELPQPSVTRPPPSKKKQPAPDPKPVVPAVQARPPAPPPAVAATTTTTAPSTATGVMQTKVTSKIIIGYRRANTTHGQMVTMQPMPRPNSGTVPAPGQHAPASGNRQVVVQQTTSSVNVVAASQSGPAFNTAGAPSSGATSQSVRTFNTAVAPSSVATSQSVRTFNTAVSSSSVSTSQSGPAFNTAGAPSSGATSQSVRTFNTAVSSSSVATSQCAPTFNPAVGPTSVAARPFNPLPDVPLSIGSLRPFNIAPIARDRLFSIPRRLSTTHLGASNPATKLMAYPLQLGGMPSNTPRPGQGPPVRLNFAPNGPTNLYNGIARVTQPQNVQFVGNQRGNPGVPTTATGHMPMVSLPVMAGGGPGARPLPPRRISITGPIVRQSPVPTALPPRMPQLPPTPAPTNNSPQAPTNATGAQQGTMLNSNEIIIELISSSCGNQLVVRGPPLAEKFSLSMRTCVAFIREIMAIPQLHTTYASRNPSLINSYWHYLSGKFKMPQNVCRACWNFLRENFKHFPQIAPMDELMRPFRIALSVWRETETLRKFDLEAVANGWCRHRNELPPVMEEIQRFSVFYRNLPKMQQQRNPPPVPSLEVQAAEQHIRLRFPHIPNVVAIWNAFKCTFWTYLLDLEGGIDNPWPQRWWRTFAALNFLMEHRYNAMQPFYYIARNKIMEQIERCRSEEAIATPPIAIATPRIASVESLATGSDTSETVSVTSAAGEAIAAARRLLKRKPSVTGEPESKRPKLCEEPVTKEKSYLDGQLPPDERISLKAPTLDAHQLMLVMLKYPDSFHPSTEDMKRLAWKNVAAEMNSSVKICRSSFRQAHINYRMYMARDPSNRCRINQCYYKPLAEMCRQIKMPRRLDEVNQISGLDEEKNKESGDCVFPDRYIQEINMATRKPSLVLKNWAFAVSSFKTTDQRFLEEPLQALFARYKDKVTEPVQKIN